MPSQEPFEYTILAAILKKHGFLVTWYDTSHVCEASWRVLWKRSLSVDVPHAMSCLVLSSSLWLQHSARFQIEYEGIYEKVLLFCWKRALILCRLVGMSAANRFRADLFPGGETAMVHGQGGAGRAGSAWSFFKQDVNGWSTQTNSLTRVAAVF